MRVQAIFLDMGRQALVRPYDRRMPRSEGVEERVAVAVGFAEAAEGIVEDGTMRQVGFAFDEGGSATVRFDREVRRPDVAFDPEDASFDHLLREPIWRAGGTMLALLSHALGSVLFRATRMPPEAPGNEVFSFIAPLKILGRSPAFNMRYTFADGARECRSPAPEAVPELGFVRGVYPDRYLSQPGWNFGGRNLALRSTMPLAVLDDLDEIERLEASGKAPGRLAELMNRRRGMLMGRDSDPAFSAFKAAMTELRCERGLDHSWSAPVDAAAIAADDALADEAIRRAMAEREASAPNP